jgi:hypothetical protein
VPSARSGQARSVFAALAVFLYFLVSRNGYRLSRIVPHGIDSTAFATQSQPTPLSASPLFFFLFILDLTGCSIINYYLLIIN